MTIISVVIPALDDAPMLAVCLDALAGQSRPADEIIVVDGRSVDDTVAVARRAGARVVSPRAPGIPAATAAGLDAAVGDVIARLDADSVPPADWLERIDDEFTRDPALAALTGPGDFYGGNAPVRWVGRVIYLGGYFWAIGALLGHPPLFGSNFALSSDAWCRLRMRTHRGLADIHDDLDLSFQIEPDMTVVFDSSLRVGVSARPFATVRGLLRRLRWAVTTIRVNLGEQPAREHRAARRAWAGRRWAGLGWSRRR